MKRTILNLNTALEKQFHLDLNSISNYQMNLNVMMAKLGKYTFRNRLIDKYFLFSIFNCRYKIKIHYETSPKATALQWLNAQQTAGKKYPYLFSQNQVCFFCNI